MESCDCTLVIVRLRLHFHGCRCTRRETDLDSRDVGRLIAQVKVVQVYVTDPFGLVQGQQGVELLPHDVSCCHGHMWPQLTCIHKLASDRCS